MPCAFFPLPRPLRTHYRVFQAMTAQLTFCLSPSKLRYRLHVGRRWPHLRWPMTGSMPARCRCNRLKQSFFLSGCGSRLRVGIATRLILASAGTFAPAMKRQDGRRSSVLTAPSHPPIPRRPCEIPVIFIRTQPGAVPVTAAQSQDLPELTGRRPTHPSGSETMATRQAARRGGQGASPGACRGLTSTR